MIEPRALSAVLAGFDELWSPRVATTVNDYDVRVAKVRGEHVWHAHERTDEFFLVLSGELTIALRGQDPLILKKGDMATIPRGVEHKPSSTAGAEILMFEPSETVSIGDRHEEAPEHLLRGMLDPRQQA